MVYFLGAGSRVVAVDRSSDYPKEVQQLPQVGDSLRLDLERVMALKPDLVLAWASGTSQSQINQLQKLGISVFVSEPLSLETIASTMRRLSVLLGSEAEKQAEIDQWLAEFKSISLISAKTKVRVFYQVWHDPLMTLSGKHVVSEVIQRCGGTTAFADARLLAPTVSLESVLQFNPQLILATSDTSSLAHWSRWTSLVAVRNKQLKVVTPDILVRSGPRILQAAKEVCALIRVAGQNR
jgi:iron complex transport system substrate-binding protein